VIVHPSQHFLLQGLVDYAGLFPPAALSLSQSLQAFRSYQQGLAPSLLGRFVCKASQLEPLRDLLIEGDAFRLSALLEAPEEVELVERFHHKVGAAVRVDTLETRLIGAEQSRRWLRRWNYSLFFEVKPDQFAEGATVCAPHQGRLGLKLRTGALQPEGIPGVPEVVDFLRVAHEAQVPYKFTAGLHHARPGEYPLSYAADAPRARLFGFVPLFGLACLHWTGRLGESALSAGLSCDAPLVQADSKGLHYAGASCSAAEIEEFRLRGARSFGSCSFEEPLQELIEMGWIC
jgi:hypothetical protein